MVKGAIEVRRERGVLDDIAMEALTLPVCQKKLVIQA